MAIESRNDQFRRLLQPQERLIGVQAEVILELGARRPKHVDIRTGAEKFLARAAQNDHMSAVIHPHAEDRRVELLHHFVRIGIGRRIVQVQYRNAILDPVMNEFLRIRHGYGHALLRCSVPTLVRYGAAMPTKRFVCGQAWIIPLVKSTGLWTYGLNGPEEPYRI